MGRLFRTTIDCDRAALPGNRPQRSQDAAGADQEAGSGAEDRQTQNGTHHPKFVRLLSRVGGIWCPEPEVRCIVSGLDRRMVFHCVRDTVHRPFQTVTISECRYRWLRLPATTFVIAHSPSRSNRRDGSVFSGERGAKRQMVRLRLQRY